MAPRLSGEQIPVQQGNSIHSGRDTRGTTLGGGKRQDLTPASQDLIPTPSDPSPSQIARK